MGFTMGLSMFGTTNLEQILRRSELLILIKVGTINQTKMRRFSVCKLTGQVVFGSAIYFGPNNIAGSRA